MIDCILVTGGAGYIGSHTVHYLIGSGIDPARIVVFDNLVYGHREHLPEGVVFVQGDLCNKNEIVAVFKEFIIESVIHFAAYAYVAESIANPGKYFVNNVGGGLNLLEAMRAGGCRRIVFSSTCATYGMAETGVISESTPQIPINPYGESKLMFERFLVWYQKIYGVQSVALRYFNAAGADFGIGESHDPETHLIPLAIDAALGKRPGLKVFGNDYLTPDGTCVRDFVHVTDLAEAHSLALRYLEGGGETAFLNLGTGNGSSVMEVIQLLEKISGRSVPHVFEERREGDPAMLVADNKKAGEVLGWRPRHDFEQIIQSAWKWHDKCDG